MWLALHYCQREANRFPSSLIVFASITSDKITDLRRGFSQCTELTQISHLSKVSGVKDVSSSCCLQTFIHLNKPPRSLMCNSKNKGLCPGVCLKQVNFIYKVLTKFYYGYHKQDKFLKKEKKRASLPVSGPCFKCLHQAAIVKLLISRTESL